MSAKRLTRAELDRISERIRPPYRRVTFRVEEIAAIIAHVRAQDEALREAHARLERVETHHPDRICGLDHRIGENRESCGICAARMEE